MLPTLGVAAILLSRFVLAADGEEGGAAASSGFGTDWLGGLDFFHCLIERVPTQRCTFDADRKLDDAA